MIPDAEGAGVDKGPSAALEFPRAFLTPLFILQHI